MHLRLRCPAHDAKAEPGLPVLGYECWDNRVEGTLTRCVGIKAPGRKIEELPSVLKDKPKARDSHARAHASVVTLNERDHVAFSIGGGEVNGIAFVEVGIARLDAERGFVW